MRNAQSCRPGIVPDAGNSAACHGDRSKQQADLSETASQKSRSRVRGPAVDVNFSILQRAVSQPGVVGLEIIS